MKAVVCRAFGPPEDLELADLPSPEPGPGRLSIRVKACGVNFPDVLMVTGKYQLRPEFPFSPGSEVSGVVSAVGPGVEGWKAGDRVIARLGHGGLREEALADVARCLPMPEGIGFEAAAGYALNYGTALYALTDRSGLKQGERLVVLGAAGGVGLAAVELGKLLGARVIAATSSQAKLDLALGRGADDGFVYPAGEFGRDAQREVTDAIKRLTDGKGADALVDPVGGAYAEPALRAMGWGGRYLVIGFAAGGIPQVPLNLVLLKGCDIRGVFYGDFVVREPGRNVEILAQLGAWISAGRLSPLVSETFPLEEAGRAIRRLADRQAMGKVVVSVG